MRDAARAPERSNTTIRVTMEAYAQTAVIEGQDESDACGIRLSKSGTWNQTFRVTSTKGIAMLCEIDRIESPPH